MANTFTQIHLQIIFAVQNRISLIAPLWETELYKYVTGIVQNNDHKLLAINGVPDHVHLLIGMRPTQALFFSYADNQAQFIRVDQRKRIYNQEIQLARRIRSIFIFDISASQRHSLH